MTGKKPIPSCLSHPRFVYFPKGSCPLTGTMHLIPVWPFIWEGPSIGYKLRFSILKSWDSLSHEVERRWSILQGNGCWPKWGKYIPEELSDTASGHRLSQNLSFLTPFSVSAHFPYWSNSRVPWSSCFFRIWTKNLVCFTNLLPGPLCGLREETHVERNPLEVEGAVLALLL